MSTEMHYRFAIGNQVKVVRGVQCPDDVHQNERTQDLRTVAGWDRALESTNTAVGYSPSCKCWSSQCLCDSRWKQSSVAPSFTGGLLSSGRQFSSYNAAAILHASYLKPSKHCSQWKCHRRCRSATVAHCRRGNLSHSAQFTLGNLLDIRQAGYIPFGSSLRSCMVEHRAPTFERLALFKWLPLTQGVAEKAMGNK